MQRFLLQFLGILPKDCLRQDHQDIEDEGQTVIVEKPVMPDTPKTGDDSNVWIWIALLVIASGTIAAVQIRKKNGQENTDDEE